MAAVDRPSSVPLSEARQRTYEALISERLSGVDATAWSLFTFALGAGRRAENLLGDVVRPHGLDGAQFSVLLVLWMQGPPHRLSPTTLSRMIAQSPSGMTHTVKRLTTSGFVTRVGLETDGRAKHVELTDEGLEVVERCSLELAKVIHELFPSEKVPVDKLAAAQRQIVEIITRQHG